MFEGRSKLLPDMLAWPLDMAVERCKDSGFAVKIELIKFTGQPSAGSSLRVVRATIDNDTVKMEVVKALTEPLGE